MQIIANIKYLEYICKCSQREIVVFHITRRIKELGSNHDQKQHRPPHTTQGA